MNYVSIEDFVDDVIASLEREAVDFKVLDITDPDAENRLEGEHSRFDPSIKQSFDNETVAKVLRAAQKSSHVNELFLGYIRIDHIVSLALLDLFQRDRVWKRLAIQGCRDRAGEACIALLASRGNIEAICLYHNELGYSGFCSVSMILSSDIATLKCLDLEDFLYPDSAEALAAGLQRNTTLRCLNLSNCFFHETALEHLSQGIARNGHLCKLDLSGCKLGDNEAAMLLGALVDHPSINYINLDHNFCLSNSCEAVATMLEANRTPKLSHLSIEHQLRFDYRIDVHLNFGLLAEPLKSNSVLKELSLSHNYVSLSDIEVLMQGVRLSTIDTLNLEYCGITDESATLVLSNLPPSARRLDLSKNPFNSAACQGLLLQTARNCEQIEFLNVEKVLGCWEELDYVVRLNAAGQRIFRSRPSIPLSVWPLILGRINRIDWKCYDEDAVGLAEDALFYMLKGPALYRSG